MAIPVVCSLLLRSSFVSQRAAPARRRNGPGLFARCWRARRAIRLHETCATVAGTEARATAGLFVNNAAYVRVMRAELIFVFGQYAGDSSKSSRNIEISSVLVPFVDSI